MADPADPSNRVLRIDPSRPDLRGYRPGRAKPVIAAWLAVEALVFRNPLVTSYPFKRWLLWFQE